MGVFSSLSDAGDNAVRATYVGSIAAPVMAQLRAPVSVASAGRLLHHLEREATHVPGVQYAMASAEKVHFEFCGGQRDLGGALPVTASTTFMAFSSTKVVTAAAVLQLIGQRRLEVDASLSQYYADHPYGSAVTIRQLLNQTSGVPNPLPINWVHRLDDVAFDEERALADVLRAHPRLSFPPGDRYAYSNLSYWLLGKVIERVSGLSYEGYLQKEIFAPLGATAAELNTAIPDLGEFARGYQRKYSAMGLFTRLAVRAAFLDGSERGYLRFARVSMNGAAYGGLLGTARGFCRFLQDQLRPASVLLGPEEKALFFSPQRDAHNRETPTTLGWHRGRLEGIAYFGKPGGGPGFHSNIRLYPERGIATAWFINHMGVDETRINQFGDAADRHWLA
jgi:D-alanyl-D-alanine carboxypeptidase